VFLNLPKGQRTLEKGLHIYPELQEPIEISLDDLAIDLSLQVYFCRDRYESVGDQVLSLPQRFLQPRQSHGIATQAMK
jgi:hypothetical protein